MLPQITNLFGTTECGGLVCKPGFFDSDEKKKFTLGKCSSSGFKLEIRDNDGNVLGPNEEGELFIWSPLRM